MQLRTNLVHHLDSTTLRPFIESNSVVLLSVLLLPISRRCREFVPEFEKIANTLQDSNISFAQIGALDNGRVLARFEITSYPRLLLLQGVDNFRTYRGPLREIDILSYLDRFMKFPVVSMISAMSLPEFRKSSGVVVVGYVAADDEASKEQFELLAKAVHPEYVFGITDDSALARAEGVDVPGVAVYNVSDGEKSTLPLEKDLNEMNADLGKAARPLIVDLVCELHDDLLDMGIPFGYVFASSPEERARLYKELEPLARKYRKGIQFGIGDPVALREIAEDLHLNVSRWPTFAIREPVANLRYPLSETKGTFSNEIKGFVQAYLDGKLKPTIKSEPIPGKSKDGVVKVVGLNYHEIVMDKAKDVLLTYCITPCGPCEALQPTLVALARLYASSPRLNNKVTIAKVMYDDNDLPERGIRGFPTIKLFPAASKSAPVLFLEDRTFDALAGFIRDHGTHKVGDARDMEESQIAPKQEVCMYVSGKRVCVDTKSDDPEQDGKIEIQRYNES